MDEKAEKHRRIVEIADYMYANPGKQPAEIQRKFAGIYGLSERTIEGYLKKAREYNLPRLQKQEKAKDDILEAEAIESLKKGILTRNELLAISSRIARGESRKLDGEADEMIPSDGDSIRAIAFLWEKLGYDEIKDTKNHHEVIIKYVNYEQKNNEKPV